MKLKMRNNLVGIINVKKPTKTTAFVIPEDNNNCGIVKYVGDNIPADSAIKEGVKVYYGKDRQTIKIKNEDVEVMEDSNILMIEEE